MKLPIHLDITRIFLIVFLLSFVFPIRSEAFANWPSDPSINTPLAVNSRPQDAGKILKDLNGGFYILYIDQSNNGGIYVQRVDGSGTKLWGSEGILVGKLSSWIGGVDRLNFVDGSNGNVIVIWEEVRQNINHVYAQKIDSSGNFLWDSNGKLISQSINLYGLNPQAVSDGLGGAIISWAYDNASGRAKITTQRINNAGQLVWNVDGVDITGFAARRRLSRIVEDGQSGAYLLYEGENFKELYIQHIDVGGHILWSQQGKLLTNMANDAVNRYSFTSDNKGGIYLKWTEYVNSIGRTVYQHIDYSGSYLWGANGLPLPFNGRLVSDKQRSLYVVSNPRITPFDLDITINKLLPDGTLGWSGNSVDVIKRPGAQFLNEFIADEDDGVVVTWSDENTTDEQQNPDNPNELGKTDIYAQRVSSDGQLSWQEGGIIVSNAPLAQIGANIGQIGSSSFAVAWTDNRNGAGTDDIYAQRVNLDGTLGDSAPSPTPTATPTPTPTPELCVLQNFGDQQGNSLLQNFQDWKDKPYGGAMWTMKDGQTKFIPLKIDDDKDGKLDEDPANSIDDDADGKKDEDGPETIGKWGCTITSATMVLNNLAKRQGINTQFTPIDVNEWLSTNNGYDVRVKTPYPSKDDPQYVNYSLLNFDKIGEFASKHGVTLSLSGINSQRKDKKGNPLETVDQFIDRSKPDLSKNLCDLNPSILEVANQWGQHFVAASGNRDGEHPLTWRIHDPLSLSPTTLLTKYSNIYKKVITYHPVSPGLKKVMMIKSFSDPAGLLITDSQGRRTGYDLRTGQYLQEIPSSFFDLDQLAAQDGSGTIQEASYIYIQNPLDGPYLLTITGTIAEDVGVELFVQNGSNSSVTRFNDFVAEGIENQYRFDLDEDAAEITEPVRKIIVDLPIVTGDFISASNSTRKIPLSILSTPTFAAVDVEFFSVKAGVANALAVSHELSDINGDGIIDNTFYFIMKNLGISETNHEVCLTGIDGFGNQIKGCDMAETTSGR